MANKKASGLAMTLKRGVPSFTLRATVPKRNYYSVLGVARTASFKLIREAYLRLSIEHHPDKKGGDEETFKEITEAYGVLKDKERRKSYDTKTEFLGKRNKCPTCKGEGSVYRTVGFTRREATKCKACGGTGSLS